MTTTSTKTRALCVATRCTTIEQFVSTFHRFCGDDQTFFVATMTSRPVGLETAFSIQLADKQPVLRGLCVVLDAWATPENRFKRPGIRLGIKRLTADSQIVFDRLKAAARAPTQLPEATPPPGPLPLPGPVGGAAGVAFTPRPSAAPPPPLPPLLAPTATGNGIPALPPDRAAPAGARPAITREPAAVAVRPPSSEPLRPPLPSLSARPASEIRPVSPSSVPSHPAGAIAPSVPLPPNATLPLPAIQGRAPALPVPPAARPAADLRPALPSVPSPTIPGPSAARARPASPATEPSRPALPAPAIQARPEPVPDPKPVAAAAQPEPAPPAKVAAVAPAKADPAPVTLAKPTAAAAKAESAPLAKPAKPTAAAAKGEPALLAKPAAAPAKAEPAPAPLAKPTAAAATAEPAPLATPAAAAANAAPASSANLAAPAPSARVAAAGAPPAASPPSEPAPIEVTRFQVALHVDTVPPPLADVEFKPTQLLPRKRAESREPKLATEPPAAPASTTASAGEGAAQPAPGNASEPAHAAQPAAPRDPAASAGPRELASRAGEIVTSEARAPGSALVLPANPLQDLSDESLEGFVDCTLYEETDNIFHPASDGPEWNDLVDSGPAAAPAPGGGSPAATVPAMPFDAPPDLMLRAVGGTESLALAAQPEPAAAPARRLPRMTTPLPLTTHDAPAEGPGGGPAPGGWFDTAEPSSGLRSSDPHAGALAAPGNEPRFAVSSVPEADDRAQAPPAVVYAHDGPPGMAPYAGTGSAAYPQYSPTQVVELPGGERIGPQQGWLRWALIVGSAVIAIVLAFIVARLARGTDRGSAATSAVGQPPTEQGPGRRASPPLAAAPGRSASSSPSPSAAPKVQAAGPAAARTDPAPAVDPPGAGETAEVDAEADGEASAGTAPIVGNGPCRFSIATTPAGSIIRFDDQPVGPSPITIAGTCDKHRVDASHARYQSVTRWVTLAADKPQQLDLNLPRPIHAVTVTSFPPGAELSIDGHRAGTTPTVVQMVGFATVNLTFTKPGFRSVTRRVYSKTAQDRVFVKLAK